MAKPLLLGCKGCGSAIVEAAFALAGIAHDYEEVDYAGDSPTRARLLSVNPLGQVPALVLPGGRVLTESLALIHYADDLAPAAGLVPPAGDASRPDFYRWLAFLIAAVYPTFTYGDDAKKWVSDEAGAKLLRESTDRHRIALFKQMEGGAGAPWFLGARFSAIDLYLVAMTRWRPGRRKLAVEIPKLVAIADRAGALPAVQPVIARNFA